MTTLSLSIVGLGLVWFFSRLADRRRTYKEAYPFYQTAHFLAGFFVAVGASAYTSNAWWIITVTFVVGFLWETGEYILAYSKSIRAFFHIDSPSHLTIADTVFDILLDVAGAGVFLLFISLL